jgi:uncharacterized membrane protein YphA (DoxX/SURF4 family)
MIFAASRWNLFVPNIDLPHDALVAFVAGLAVVAAFSFITGVLTRLGALLAAALVVAAFGFATHPEEVVEQVIFVGIAFYLAVVGRGVVRYADRREDGQGVLTVRLRPFALPVLRVSAGVSVLVLAFTEKLLNARLGVAFLDEYPHFNVARELGVDWFTDRRFVFAVGIVEAMAGFALIAGFLPRLVILALWIPFNLGIAFLPPQELIGHLPILSTIYVLLIRGTEGIPPREVAPAGGSTRGPADAWTPATVAGSPGSRRLQSSAGGVVVETPVPRPAS